MKTAYTIIRVSAEDQLRGYGPDAQWYEDILPTAPALGLEVSEELRAVIQEPATGWDRERYVAAVRHVLGLFHEGKIAALLFPRVDRETRHIFYSLGLLSEVLRNGMEVYYARERLRVDPDDYESVDRYLAKANQAQAYVDTMRLNTIRGKKRRALQDHKMPQGGRKWAFIYVPGTGRYQKHEERAAWVARCYRWILEEGLSLNRCCRRLEEAGVPPPGWEAWKAAAERGRTRQRVPRADRWYRYTLRQILSDPANVGKFYAYQHKVVRVPGGRKKQVATDPQEWVLVYEDPAQAIVSEDQLAAMHARMEDNKRNSPRHAKHPYPPLRGLVRCTLCARTMVGWTNGSRGIGYYKCEVCRNLVQAWPLWGEVREGITARLLEPGRLLPGMRAQLASGESLERLEAEQRELEEQVTAREHARDKARRLYLLAPDYPEEKYLADDRRLQEDQRKAEARLGEVRQEVAALRQARVDEEGVRRFCAEAGQNLKEMDDARWRLLLERLRLKVEVTPGEPAVASLALPAQSPDGTVVSASSES